MNREGGDACPLIQKEEDNLSEDLQAELARLRAENERLNRERVENPEIRMRLDSGLNRLAQSASREAQAYRQIQAGGLTVNIGQPSEAAYEAADYILDMFL